MSGFSFGGGTTGAFGTTSTGGIPKAQIITHEFDLSYMFSDG